MFAYSVGGDKIIGYKGYDDDLRAINEKLKYAQNIKIILWVFY